VMPWQGDSWTERTEEAKESKRSSWAKGALTNKDPWDKAPFEGKEVLRATDEAFVKLRKCVSTHEGGGLLKLECIKFIERMEEYRRNEEGRTAILRWRGTSLSAWPHLCHGELGTMIWWGRPR